MGVTLVSVMNTEMPALTGYAASANSTMYTYVSASYNGLNLTTILPIVLFAAVVLSLVIGGFMALRNSGMLAVTSSITNAGESESM